MINCIHYVDNRKKKIVGKLISMVAVLSFRTVFYSKYYLGSISVDKTAKLYKLFQVICRKTIQIRNKTSYHRITSS